MCELFRAAIKEQLNSGLTDVLLKQGWTSHGQKNDVAITPDGGKAFVSWANEGVEKSGEHNVLTGMSMLIFNKAGQIAQVVAFREPLKSEKASMFK